MLAPQRLALMRHASLAQKKHSTARRTAAAAGALACVSPTRVGLLLTPPRVMTIPTTSGLANATAATTEAIGELPDAHIRSAAPTLGVLQTIWLSNKVE